MEYLTQELHYTSQYFRNNLGIELHGDEGQSILSDLLDHLKMDGYDVADCSQCSRRFLAGQAHAEQGSTTFITDVVLVVVCVVCAGFASGLTQVRIIAFALSS
jgi:hypothetical protein